MSNPVLDALDEAIIDQALDMGEKIKRIFNTDADLEYRARKIWAEVGDRWDALNKLMAHRESLKASNVSKRK